MSNGKKKGKQAKKGKKASKRVRAQGGGGKYNPVPCQKSGDADCATLKVWGAAWETWGQTLLRELDKIEVAICRLEQQVYYGIPSPGAIWCNAAGRIPAKPGDPPTDTGQPPLPPFR